MPEASYIVDENRPRSSLRILKERGFDTVDVREIGLRGATDDAIIAYAKDEGRVVLTRDTDFGSVLRILATQEPSTYDCPMPSQLQKSMST